MGIHAKNLTKKYATKTTALNNISLAIDTGVFGLLGKNGSGKTTFMRLITTLLEPTQGELTVFGLDAAKKENHEEIKRNIGYLPQEFGFYKDFSILEIMQYICFMRGIEKTKQRKMIDELLEKVNLVSQKKKKYKQLSGGMKRRVGLAQAIIGSPPILIVDEPTAGVDPEERMNIRKFLNEYAVDKTVLFSTHIVEDIEYTCNKLAILNDGNLLYSGTLDHLLQQVNGKICECIFPSLQDFQAFETRHKVISFKRDGEQFCAVVASNGEPLPNSRPIHASLEEAYVYLTTAKEGEK